jgi:aspartyl/asparaginyl-tRNA synthetase
MTDTHERIVTIFGGSRCTAWMCGIEHIRETIPFTRMLYRLRH